MKNNQNTRASTTLYDFQYSNFQYSMTTNPYGRFNKPNWYETHLKQENISKKNKKISLMLLGDSIVAGLSRYHTVWKKYFNHYTVNCGIGGDRLQHTLWRSINLDIPDYVKSVFICCGTNNLDNDTTQDIVNGLLCIAFNMKKKKNDLNIIISGILPRDLHPSQ